MQKLKWEKKEISRNYKKYTKPFTNRKIFGYLENRAFV